MFRDVSSCNSYNYGDALYWNARYVQEAGSFDWYQRYSALRPFVRKYVPTSSRVLMVGCGNAVMSEDMVKDGYQEVVNVDISSVAIDMMKKKHENIPQLTYIQMDARDMGFFSDESFDSVIDKGTLDSLMCGTDGPLSASQMLGEVSRLLKPGGTYMLITYGDPKVRMLHLNKPGYNWNTALYIIRKSAKVDRVLMCWWAFTGLTHMILEGYFTFSPEFYKDKTVCFLAEVWKEYSKGDSRYAARASDIVAVEGITAVLEGPACLLAIYAIATRKSYSYILQFAICLGQLYGAIVYFVTAILDGDNFAASPFHYYAYYIGANFSWLVIPTIIAIWCWKKICAAVAISESQKKTKTH